MLLCMVVRKSPSKTGTGRVRVGHERLSSGVWHSKWPLDCVRGQKKEAMHLMMYLNDKGERVYTLKVRDVASEGQDAPIPPPGPEGWVATVQPSITGSARLDVF